MDFSANKVSRGKTVKVVCLAQQRTAEDWSAAETATVIGIASAAAIATSLLAHPAVAQSMFPDVPEDYWAQPFIEQLAQEGIVTGYPDGTFRPQETLDRDEYAAIIRQAFELDSERSIASASTFSDVPEGYWAEPAIEEAYQMGFMDLPATNEFNPKAEISRADAIVALVQGLDLSEAATATATASPQTTAAVPEETAQPSPPPFQFAFAIATTELMQLFAPSAAASAVAPTVAAAPTTVSAAPTTAIDLGKYYADAEQIPDYARDEVALATQLGLIANYPEVNLLNPAQPISRGGTAALVHQTLVYLDQLQPLPEASPASSYLVGGDAAGAQ